MIIGTLIAIQPTPQSQLFDSKIDTVSMEHYNQNMDGHDTSRNLLFYMNNVCNANYVQSNFIILIAIYTDSMPLQGEFNWTSLQYLSNLVTLDIGHNQFPGTLPWKIFQNLTKLTHVYLQADSLNGTVDFTYLPSSLQLLAIERNLFDGTISNASWKALQSIDLTELSMHSNEVRIISRLFRDEQQLYILYSSLETWSSDIYQKH